MTPPIKPPTDNRPRVYRGSGWNYRGAAWVRVAHRDWYEPSDRYSRLGFRTTQTGCRQPLKG